MEGKVLSKECTFCYDPLPNMAATGNFKPSDGKSSYCLWQGFAKKNIKM
jgi:hypothetical protein